MSKSNNKSAKMLEAAGKKAAAKKAAASGGLPKKREVPWLTVGAVVVVLALIGGIAWSIYPMWQKKQDEKREAERLAVWEPSAQNPDPSTKLAGIVIKEYPQGLHVQPNQRVAYDQSPPFGGPHDGNWADCMGVVYPTAIRTENAVHSLEHGAVWIAYNPDTLKPADKSALEDRVTGKPYTIMSPYPGLDKPIALLAWGHQPKVDSAEDERVAQFITALRQNANNAPEPNGSCSNPTFDPNASTFVAEPPVPGPDTVPMDGAGLSQDSSELGMGSPLGPAETAPAAPAEPAPAPLEPAPAG